MQRLLEQQQLKVARQTRPLEAHHLAQPRHQPEAHLLVAGGAQLRKAPQTEDSAKLIVSDDADPTPSANLWLGVFFVM
jgi:hypothetical protein